MKATRGKQLYEVDATTLKEWIAKDEAVLVDVREPSEHAGERIPEARLVPLSTFDPTRMPPGDGRKVVLHCLSGDRSAQAGRRLVEAGVAQVYHLHGGLQAWKAAGYATERSLHAPISMQRQVQMVAGSLVFLGTVLGAWFSPWFLILSGFVGAGLTFAGITGTCGMAMLLARLPYNRKV
jgi:rhodanese-related sulfurtransferase